VSNDLSHQAFIVLSGIPGTGKSTYSGWLQREHGFTHFDLDRQGGLPSAQVLERRPLVIDWGFPANEPGLSSWLALIGTWKSDGAKLWWFDGDRDAALASFLKRKTVSKEAWDIQLHGIMTNWKKIEPAIDGMVNVIMSDGYLAPEVVFETMFPKSRGGGN
jgi:hypothetical protein